jgi:hypothetical protein
MDPDKITLSNLTKNFEYAKVALEIDSCTDVEQLQNIAKCYVKLYLKTQETFADLVK